MKDERMNHQGVFGETPEIFAVRVTRTLTDLKEGKPMKKSFSGILITALVLMLLCAAALAAVNGVGLDWFYKNIYSNHPLPEDMDSRIQNDLLYTAEHPLMDLKVQSAAWFPKGYDQNFPDDYLLEILVSIRPKDPEKYEVHAWDTMNNDGNRENRSEDHIVTPKGIGPIQKMMLDPNKTLLLYGREAVIDLIDGNHAMGLSSCQRIFDYDPDGNLLAYYSCPVSSDAYAAIRSIYADANNSVTLHYRDESWLWNAQGAEKGLVQSGIVAITVKLPE